MSWTEQDVKDEEAMKIDASWTRLRQLMDKGKRDAPIRLTGKETDTTTLMCYSSGGLWFVRDPAPPKLNFTPYSMQAPLV